MSFRRDTFVPTTWTRDRHGPNFLADLVNCDDLVFFPRPVASTSSFTIVRHSGLPVLRDVQCPWAGPEHFVSSTFRSWLFGQVFVLFASSSTLGYLASLATPVGIVDTFLGHCRHVGRHCRHVGLGISVRAITATVDSDFIFGQLAAQSE